MALGSSNSGRRPSCEYTSMSHPPKQATVGDGAGLGDPESLRRLGRRDMWCPPPPPSLRPAPGNYRPCHPQAELGAMQGPRGTDILCHRRRKRGTGWRRACGTRLSSWTTASYWARSRIGRCYVVRACTRSEAPPMSCVGSSASPSPTSRARQHGPVGCRCQGTTCDYRVGRKSGQWRRGVPILTRWYQHRDGRSDCG